MDSPAKEPETLIEAIRYFSDPDVANRYFAKIRWPDGPVCPRCGRAKDHYYVKSRWLWQCKGCKKQFSVKVGTIFEDSPIGMDKWLPAMWTLVDPKNYVSSYELARELGVTQKTAWFMLYRLELATWTDTFKKQGGYKSARGYQRRENYSIEIKRMRAEGLS